MKLLGFSQDGIVLPVWVFGEVDGPRSDITKQFLLTQEAGKALSRGGGGSVPCANVNPLKIGLWFHNFLLL
jgi:hypothetical protein